MRFILCRQNDEVGINALNGEHFSAFYVFEHVACSYHKYFLSWVFPLLEIVKVSNNCTFVREGARTEEEHS